MIGIPSLISNSLYFYLLPPFLFSSKNIKAAVCDQHPTAQINDIKLEPGITDLCTTKTDDEEDEQVKDKAEKSGEKKTEMMNHSVKKKAQTEEKERDGAETQTESRKGSIKPVHGTFQCVVSPVLRGGGVKCKVL